MWSSCGHRPCSITGHTRSASSTAHRTTSRQLQFKSSTATRMEPYRVSEVRCAAAFDSGSCVHRGGSPGADSTTNTCFCVSYHNPSSLQPLSCASSPLQSISRGSGSPLPPDVPAKQPSFNAILASTQRQLCGCVACIEINTTL